MKKPNACHGWLEALDGLAWGKGDCLLHYPPSISITVIPYISIRYSVGVEVEVTIDALRAITCAE
jgi:hypothetical protein